MEPTEGLQEALLVPGAQDRRKIRHSRRGEPRDRAEDRTGSLQVETALGAGRSGLGEGRSAVGALDHSLSVYAAGPGREVRNRVSGLPEEGPRPSGGIQSFLRLSRPRLQG